MATAARNRKTFRIAFDDSDIAGTAGTSLTRTLTAEQIGVGLGVFVVHAAQCVVITGAAGGGVSSLTVSAGRSGAPTAWLDAAQLVESSPPAIRNGNAINLAYNVTDTTAEAARFTFTATGGNLNALTAGEAILSLDVEELGEAA